MFDKIPFRYQLIAMAAIPTLITAILAAGALFKTDISFRTYGIFALSGLAVSITVCVLVFQNIIRMMRQLRHSAQSLAENGSYYSYDVNDKTEVGEIAKSLDSIYDSAEGIKQLQRDAIKKGISGIVVNLARRSQTLLDRQVEVIDDLQSGEENPERLEKLFKVDHLATRMRRNSESLLVLAEADPGKRRGEPVLISDVMRVAMGEVENYDHIALANEDDASVSAGAAVDLAHLLAELIENASQFSPPETKVEVLGKFNIDGDYVVNVIDHGVGMSETQLETSNAVLAEPPEMTLGMSRSLGFNVVGRLAKRLSMFVNLYSTPGSGVTSVVKIPQSLLRGQVTGKKADGPANETNKEKVTTKQKEAKGEKKVVEEAQAEESLDPIKIPLEDSGNKKNKNKKGKKQEVEPAAEESEGKVTEFGDIPDPVKVEDRPQKLDEVIPEGEAFDKGVKSLLQEPKRGSSGLTKRKRGASKITTGESRTISTASTRKPDEIRTMLSKYREGLKGGGSAAKPVVKAQAEAANVKMIKDAPKAKSTPAPSGNANKNRKKSKKYRNRKGDK